VANTIITLILSFNIILLVLYFIVRINRRHLDNAQEAYTKAVEDEKKKSLTSKESEQLTRFISGSTIPQQFSAKPSFTFTHGPIGFSFIEKGVFDKNTPELGAIITRKTDSHNINFLPISLLGVTKKNAFYVRNDDKKLIGLFTPFYIILINTETLHCTRSVENDLARQCEDIALTGYSRQDTAVSHFVAKFHTPFLSPCQFAETYYPLEFKGFITE